MKNYPNLPPGRAMPDDQVNRRISSYNGEHDDWFMDWFTPTLEVIDIRSISWETIQEVISENDSMNGESLNEYYSKCLTLNS
jgi:hypothetical protein